MKLEHDKYAENIFLTFLTTNWVSPGRIWQQLSLWEKDKNPR
jgi:hypothetical protein